MILTLIGAAFTFMACVGSFLMGRNLGFEQGYNQGTAERQNVEQPLVRLYQYEFPTFGANTEPRVRLDESLDDVKRAWDDGVCGGYTEEPS